MTTLQLSLLLLGASVLAVIAFRRLNMPPLLGYLLVGTAIGPHALNLMEDSAGASHLAEFGVVFLMFSIGLEFSLTKLHAMKRIVFGLGALQVVVTLLLSALICMLFDMRWQGGVALGGVLAMSSTAVLTKLLTERLELDSKHGREVMGVLLFQDLAVVPLLILIPSFGQSPERMAVTMALAVLKAFVILSLVLYLGQRLMRKWFFIVARGKSAELFMLNVLLITLGLAYLTEIAGLSLALGAFVAGMLISETEYRYQVEEDIKPFRDVLMGLFFVTIGMLLDMHLVLANFWLVLAVLAAMLLLKFAVAGGLSRLLGSAPGTAIRTGLWLCAGGEFGFVLLAEIKPLGLVPSFVSQAVLAALVLSMLIAPLIVHYSDRIALRFARSEWLLRSMELTNIFAQSMGNEKHAIICGFGRSGQTLARFMAQEEVSYVALDLDPERVREAGAAGENVVFGDAARREALVAAGVTRASVLIVTFADARAAERILHLVHELKPDLPVVVRTYDDTDMERLRSAGAAEVVPESLEASMMLASHALVLIGVPINRVLKRVREMRSGRYQLLRGFFHGQSDREEDVHESEAVRLHSVTMAPGASAIGRALGDIGCAGLGVTVSAVRRRNIRALEPSDELRFQEGDVVVLLGRPDGLAVVEERLLKG
ncbi:MAG TPA: monovalent cation:proton antiporter-2 (CPA2) family protein [Azospira sp.]|nr:monovalent cation:proton antiporter-2 (CPA2) family protein [Azospira sp.]HNN08754.1 monovalent cation:proton antiporter-2 (CPA2) family protein [Azospira sp.]HNN44715.1 monovalent cation:proton antiporter-2 (CPA2) family protein [Azospira sp.]